MRVCVWVWRMAWNERMDLYSWEEWKRISYETEMKFIKLGRRKKHFLNWINNGPQHWHLKIVTKGESKCNNTSGKCIHMSISSIHITQYDRKWYSLLVAGISVSLYRLSSLIGSETIEYRTKKKMKKKVENVASVGWFSLRWVIHFAFSHTDPCDTRCVRCRQFFSLSLFSVRSCVSLDSGDLNLVMCYLLILIWFWRLIQYGNAINIE